MQARGTRAEGDALDAPPSPRSRESALSRAFFALTFLVYVGVYPYLAQINNPNENVRTYMTMALVEGHTLAVDAVVARHGWVNDMAKIAAPGSDEPHLYSVKGPAVSYAGVPVYWVFTKAARAFGSVIPRSDAPEADRARWLRNATFVLRLFVVQLPCFAFLVAFERWLRRVTADEALRLTAVAAVGLGTNYLAYSHMFVSHALTAVTAFSAFALATSALDRDAPRAPARGFAAGLAAATTTLLDYHALPVSFVLAVYALYAFRAPRAWAAIAAGAAVPALVLMHFHACAFGSPFTTGHRLSENADYAALLNQGFLGLTFPSARAARLLLFSRSFGLFGTSPFLAVGLLAIPFGIFTATGEGDARRRSRVASSSWLVAMALLWLTVSAAVNWRGGWTIGPRYLGAAPPFFAFGAVSALEHMARLRPRGREVTTAIAAGLALVGVVQTGLVSLFVSGVPEELTRPLTQLVFAFLREGRAPYHLGDVVGWTSSSPWIVVASALVLASVLAAVAGVARARFTLRVVVALVVALVFLVPVLLPGAAPTPDARARVTAAVSALRDAWEPARR